MKEAADRLTQYFQLLDQAAATGEGDATTPPSQALSTNRAAEKLMQQAQKALADSLNFQRLLAEIAPKPIRGKAQQRLMSQLYTCNKHDCKNAENLAQWVKQKLQKIVESVQEDTDLCELIQQIQGLPHDSSDRRNLIPTLLIAIQHSDRRRQSFPNVSTEEYSDILHETMLWFCDHLDDYDPTLSGPMHWFNLQLLYQKRNLMKSLHRNLPKRYTNTEKEKISQGGPDAYDPLIIEAEYQILDELYDWVQQDTTGKLKRISLTNRLDINVQTVIKAVLDRIRVLRSLGRAAAGITTAEIGTVTISTGIEPYDILFDQPTTLSQLFEYLSTQLEYPPDKLRRFWRERCRPCIQDFLQQSGNG